MTTTPIDVKVELKLLDKLTFKSQMTEKDALEIGELIKHVAAKKLGFI